MHGIFFMISLLSCSKLRMSKNYFEFRICIFIFSVAYVSGNSSMNLVIVLHDIYSTYCALL